MSTLNLVQTDGPADPYDHAISLIDTTAPAEPRSRSPSPASINLVKQPTGNSVREQLARRKFAKYAKYQESRYSPKPGSVRVEKGGEPETAAKPKDDDSKPAQNRQAGETSDTGAADFVSQDEETRRGRKVKDHHKHKINQETYEIDILYENQRGSFFFGIPLYSHSSLLNFDPAPWVTKEFKDSAVNITNAQVPDPSWMWSWKTWYVDMSYDVDEQGWQYSFHFNRKFSWHGTHPWFHSFVRRRRWLRKRVKRSGFGGPEKDGSLSAAHKLTGDYFTIHSKREKSPRGYLDDPVQTARPSSYIIKGTATDIDEPPEDIKDIPSLLRALRLAKIDREKVVLVKTFIEQGGDELQYLGDKIPEVMSFMVFQNSRRQLLQFLQKAAQDAQKHIEDHDAENQAEDAIIRRCDNLQSAIEAADSEIRELEYWSDRKHVLRTADDSNGQTHTSKSDATALEDSPVDEIKGISKDAELDDDQTLDRLSQPLEGQQKHNAQDKGKGKAVDPDIDQQEHEKKQEEPGPRLEHDSVFIADEGGNG